MAEATPTLTERLGRHRRALIIGVAVVVLLGIGAVFLSAALFTSGTKNSATVSAGTLRFTVTPASGIVDTSALRPGATKTGNVTITNTDATGKFTLTFAGLGSGPLVGVLGLTVAETAPASTSLYNGSLSAVTPLALGTLAKNASVTLALTFTWPSASNDPSLQGQSVPLVLQFDATT